MEFSVRLIWPPGAQTTDDPTCVIDDTPRKGSRCRHRREVHRCRVPFRRRACGSSGMRRDVSTHSPARSAGACNNDGAFAVGIPTARTGLRGLLTGGSSVSSWGMVILVPSLGQPADNGVAADCRGIRVRPACEYAIVSISPQVTRIPASGCNLVPQFAVAGLARVPIGRSWSPMLLRWQSRASGIVTSDHLFIDFPANLTVNATMGLTATWGFPGPLAGR